MRDVKGFSGTQILTWTALENHFHILLYTPERQDVADEELIADSSQSPAWKQAVVLFGESPYRGVHQCQPTL